MRIFAGRKEADLLQKTETLFRELQRWNKVRIRSMSELDAYECAISPLLARGANRVN